MFFKRILKPLDLLDKSSHFLFGARGVGKSMLIRNSLPDDVQYIDLLDGQIYLRLAAAPYQLAAMLTRRKVVIDEVQRIPELLNEVHRLIEEKSVRFLLTGSSARKLKVSNSNLLAGRALHSDMLPLTWRELEDAGRFNLGRYLRFGGLPHIWSTDVDPAEYLASYVQYYVSTEIERETQIRDLAAFHRFLKFGSTTSSQVLNFSKLADDAQVASHTVREYYQILEDTLIGFMLPAFTRTHKRKAIQKSKFYLFDLGVKHASMQLSTLDRESDLYGQAFEQFIVLECRAYLSYSKKRMCMSFWRSQQQDEVDLILGSIAIEIKASEKASIRDHRGLLRFKEESLVDIYLVVSQDPLPMQCEDGVRHLHFSDFLSKLWQGDWDCYLENETRQKK